MNFLSVLSTLALLFIASYAGHASEVQVEKGISYLPDGRSEKGDLYLPVESDASNVKARRPAIVIMHGGGWIGDQRDSDREVNIATNLAGHGYVCFSIDYWLADPEGVKDCCWPQNIHDCKTAVRWLRAHASKYHIDVDHIGAIGGSAGGHLAAMLSVTGPECGLDPTSPLSDFSARVQCAVDMYGPVDIENWLDHIKALIQPRSEAPELYKAFSVLTYVTPDDAPILILQGTKDHVVAVSQSESLAQKLAQQGVPHHLEIIEGAGHSFDLQPEQRDLRPQVFAFFDQHLRDKRTQ